MMHETVVRAQKNEIRKDEKRDPALLLIPSHHHHHKKILIKNNNNKIQNTTTTTTSRSFMMIAIMKRLIDGCFRTVHPAVRRGLLFLINEAT